MYYVGYNSRRIWWLRACRLSSQEELFTAVVRLKLCSNHCFSTLDISLGEKVLGLHVSLVAVSLVCEMADIYAFKYRCSESWRLNAAGIENWFSYTDSSQQMVITWIYCCALSFLLASLHSCR